jgi:hypothetical protein
VQRASIVITSTIRPVVASVHPADPAGKVVVVPSSPRGTDRLAETVADRLRGASGALMVEVHPNQASAGLMRSRVGNTAWQTVDLQALDPSCDLDRATLPRRFVEADALIVACDLDLVAERGPYVLDVIASRAALATKVRLHARQGRIAAAAELNLAVRMRGCVLALTVDGDRWYVATQDPIAGELVALALTEQTRAAARSVVVPWEDPIVQRATELQLGVLTPEALEVVIDEDVAGNRVAEAIAHQLRRRIGLEKR